ELPAEEELAGGGGGGEGGELAAGVGAGARRDRAVAVLRDGHRVERRVRPHGRQGAIIAAGDRDRSGQRAPPRLADERGDVDALTVAALAEEALPQIAVVVVAEAVDLSQRVGRVAGVVAAGDGDDAAEGPRAVRPDHIHRNRRIGEAGRVTAS